MPESKLKRLVSEGEIRAFREGDVMKFRKSDVENLDITGSRSEEETGVIDLSKGKEETSETLTDDLIFDEGDDLDLTSAEAGMATAEISSQDTFVDEGVGMSTEPLAAVEEETEVVEKTDRKGARTTTTTRTRRVVESEEPHDLGWAVLMTVTTIALVLAFIVVMGIRDVNVGDGRAPEMASKLADKFGTHEKTK